MLDLLRARLAMGMGTSDFPARPVPLPERFRGRPVFSPGLCPNGCRECGAAAPSQVVAAGPDGTARLDLGACLFAPEEAEACSHGALRFTPETALGSTSRDGLLTAGGEPAAIQRLDASMRRLLGRSLRLRSVSAGSCNGCEAELVALGNAVFDMARFGIQFVASPRHADGIVLTGAVSRNMEEALLMTYQAVPAPKLVIAVGACAISGGPFRGSPEVLNGAPASLPVDLWIPGCPPHPHTTLQALLEILGRMDRGER
ncbi:MAG TPA: NADH-quinone oxidoreductase subunit NuoB [Gemmatimonadales bacterium]|nr:NADH-quinone oxidoreductase subunit NuoB [Gemmatimonadales bacterium]